MWTEDHALAWHLEEKFRKNSAAWAEDKCLAWDQLETNLKNFLSEIIDCPCTLAQARADTGRFHVSITSTIGDSFTAQYLKVYPGCVRKCELSLQNVSTRSKTMSRMTDEMTTVPFSCISPTSDRLRL